MLAFGQVVAVSPVYADADYSVPPDAEAWVEGASQLVRGDVISIEAAPTEEVVLWPPETPPTLGQRNLAVRIIVTSTSGAASSFATGDDATLLLPVARGPFAAGDAFTEEYVKALLDVAPPSGTQILVAAGPAEGDVIRPASITGVVVAAQDGSGATLLSAPDKSGQLFGTSSLEQIEAAAGLR